MCSMVPFGNFESLWQDLGFVIVSYCNTVRVTYPCDNSVTDPSSRIRTHLAVKKGKSKSSFAQSTVSAASSRWHSNTWTAQFNPSYFPKMSFEDKHYCITTGYTVPNIALQFSTIASLTHVWRRTVETVLLARYIHCGTKPRPVTVSTAWLILLLRLA